MREGAFPLVLAEVARTYKVFSQCDAPYHLTCLNPPLSAVPEGEWFCPKCIATPGAPVGRWAQLAEAQAGAKRKAPVEDAGEFACGPRRDRRFDARALQHTRRPASDGMGMENSMEAIAE